MKSWMLRAGENGYLIHHFIQARCVSLGWDDLGDLSCCTQEDIEANYQACYPDDTPVRRGLAISMIKKFVWNIEAGDRVVSYDPINRIYHVGSVTGSYAYDDQDDALYSHRRSIAWEAKICRDLLSTQAKASLGSMLTLFQLNEDIANEFEALLDQPIKASSLPKHPEQDAFAMQQEFKNIESKSREFIKDKICAISPDALEHLVAGLLRAMGFKTRVSPKGRDRGLDVLASPDGFGLQNPIIKVQVKHTQSSIGAPELRNFISILRAQERGLYVSTGGFSREARFEGERATTPVTMIDIEELLDLIIEYYDQFDTPAQMLLPLTKTYWPH